MTRRAQRAGGLGPWEARARSHPAARAPASPPDTSAAGRPSKLGPIADRANARLRHAVDHSVRLAHPLAGQRAGVARIDQLLDLELVQRPDRAADALDPGVDLGA